MATLEDLERTASHLVRTPAWQALARHAGALSATHLRELLDEPDRFDRCSRRCGDFLLDFSRQRVTDQTLRLLIALAVERAVPRWIEALFAGLPVNGTEHRPALHMALRGSAVGAPSGATTDGTDIQADVTAERNRMLALAGDVRTGRVTGATGQPIRHVVNIGIGGSDLGLVMATEALHEYASPDIRTHFVSNIDGTQLADVLARVPPEQTLFIICSKSFGTLETKLNAEAARAWLCERLGEGAVPRHFLAVSVNGPAMDRFGIAPEYRFRLWDWVGGRYSLWSSIGLAVAIAIGADHFRDLLAGGYALDEHFRSSPLADNLPVLLALLAVWNQNHQGVASHVVLPYDARLHRFPAYLQQLEMESNGKRVTRDGEPVQGTTGTVIWGEPGSNAQHSFFQLLHQGTTRFSADFIAPARGSGPYPDLHLHGLANLLAQADAFARGHDASAVQAELAGQGRDPAEIERLVPHKVHPGNHPSSLLLFPKLDPRSLGFLVALYEHKVFVEAAIWGINPFDQWGVELGKKLASGMYAALTGGPAAVELPPAGEYLLRHL